MQLQAEVTIEELPAVEEEPVPWPSDNEWGIPTLDITMQAEVLAAPVIRWGKYKQTTNVPGTYHFYTDDSKFSILWRKPELVLATSCSTVVEVNYSTYQSLPKTIALYDIYRKRCLACYWQSQGLRVLVDLNVEPKFAKLNLLGVPKGWKAYATRGQGQETVFIEYDFALAAEHAETEDLLFVVYGGTKGIKEFCRERGWIWLPEDVRSSRGQE